jgi:biopolymer transport protein ExbD
MTSTDPSKQQSEEDEYEALREANKYRRSRRKARESANEIRELNITAMMDMMTILLVFLLKSYTSSSTTVQMTDALQVPNSTTQEKPQDAIIVTVSQTEVNVNDKRVTDVIKGTIPAKFHENDDPKNMMLPDLFDALGAEVEKQKFIAKYNSKAPFTGQINVVADKRIPYQTILAVLYTAGRAELSKYKLMALRTE